MCDAVFVVFCSVWVSTRVGKPIRLKRAYMDVISRNLPVIEWHIRFTRVPFNS